MRMTNSGRIQSLSISAIEHKLTEKQEEIVNYTGEELLIKGIAGSGKTTVLLRKAVKLIKADPTIRIGLFTYNKTLSHYAKQIAKHIGEGNLFVYTFHGWAFSTIKAVQNKKYLAIVSNKDQSSYLQKAINFVKKRSKHRFVENEKFTEFLMEEIAWMKGKGIETEEQYFRVSRLGRGSSVRVTKSDRPVIFELFKAYESERLLSNKIEFDDFASILLNEKKKIEDNNKFDVVMVDEAQDLQQLQLQLLNYIAKSMFIVAADKGQKIYKTSFSWKDIGINILGGRTKILQNSFRSTKQIIQMAHSLQMNDSIIDDEEYVKPILPDFTGPVPDVYKCSSKEQQDAAIINAVKKLKENNPDQTIGILARNWRSINRLYYSFQAQNIPYEYIKKDQGDTHSPGIKLTTFHSAKGLEFDFVIIIDLVDNALDQELQDEEYMEVERRLLYVSITRAKRHLQLYYFKKPMSLLNEIESKYYNLQEI